MSTTTTPQPTRDWRLWWFARLESTILRKDWRAAKDAMRHLARLGVEIRFTLPPLPEDQGVQLAE
jgi:hypothetical protein